MDKGTASAFVYAASCGMISKSFAGKNAGSLFSVKSLSELYVLLFASEVPLVPEKLLSKLIEYKARQKFFDEYKKLLSAYSQPDRLFSDLLKFYDYENIKEIASLLSVGNHGKPELVIPESGAGFRYEKWPDIKKITEKTDLSWYDRIFSVDELRNVDNRIDVQYFREVWASASAIGDESRDDVLALIKEEIVMRNVIWALRLKVYYKFDRDEIASSLAYEGKKLHRHDVFAKDALLLLDKDVESYNDWSGWKYRAFLNPFQEGSVWTIDPAWVERSWKRSYIKKLGRMLHKRPLTALVMVCFFKLKQNELDFITAVAEGLRLDADQDSMLKSVGLA